MEQGEDNPLAELYVSFGVAGKDQFHFRRLLEEYLLFLDGSRDSSESLEEQLKQQIASLQKTFKGDFETITAAAKAREVDEMNILFNRIKRLKEIVERLPEIESLLQNLAQDKEFRANLATAIDQADNESPPSLWSRFVENVLFAFGGRPK